jgi:hypothetical protein
MEYPTLLGYSIELQKLAVHLKRARLCKRMARGGSLLNRCGPGIMSTLFNQHLFDFTPLLE